MAKPTIGELRRFLETFVEGEAARSSIDCWWRKPLLSENGFARRKCWDRFQENNRILEYFSNLPESTHVCAKCAVMLPCSFVNPVK